MTDSPAYVVVGRGRWAVRMKSILAGEGRVVSSIDEARRIPAKQLETRFKNSGAQIAWLCVPPGDHIPTMMEAGIEAGLHIVVEKPWLCSATETRGLEALAKARHAVLAIHYEYCLLEKVQSWRQQHQGGAGLAFGGRFHVDRQNHLDLPALDNLGSHLFAIHEYCVPGAAIGEIDCAYEQPDLRRVWLERDNSRIDEIDLLANREPVIQRFIAELESAILGANFEFGLDFALRVAKARPPRAQ